MQIKFNTLQELQQNFPVGSVFTEWDEEKTVKVNLFTKEDFEIVHNKYNKIEPINEQFGEFKATYTKHNVRYIDGYIYDGEYWYPAHYTWYGWIPYCSTDLKENKNE